MSKILRPSPIARLNLLSNSPTRQIARHNWHCAHVGFVDPGRLEYLAARSLFVVYGLTPTMEVMAAFDLPG